MSQQKRLKRPVEQVRAELLADPDTKKIAEAMRMDLKAYVELVLDYAQNPDKEPQLKVASQEELAAAGYDAPTPEEVGKFFLAGARGELGLESQHDKTGFDSAPAASGKPSLSGTEGQTQASVDSSKSQELMDQVRKGGGKFS
jgi:hypothetical protein